jgi:hypothetical protein
MPATHPLARYAALVISRNEPFRTTEPRRLPAPAETEAETPAEPRRAPARIVLPRQRGRSTLANEQ